MPNLHQNGKKGEIRLSPCGVETPGEEAFRQGKACEQSSHTRSSALPEKGRFHYIIKAEKNQSAGAFL